MLFSVHQTHLFLIASFFGVRFWGVIGPWALTLLDGLDVRVLGLDIRLGDGLRPLVGVDWLEFEFLLWRKMSRYSLSPGLVLC